LLQVGGHEGLLKMHNQAMKAVGFNSHEPVFVASAIFSIDQMSPDNLEKVVLYSSDLIGGQVRATPPPPCFCQCQWSGSTAHLPTKLFACVMEPNIGTI
jgi:hypothetical protein